MLLGKSSALSPFLPSLEWIRWSLVIHVILSSILWFIGIHVAIVQRSHSESEQNRNSAIWKYASFWGLICSAVGVLFLFSATLSPATKVVLSNYVPVITHDRYWVGLSLCFIGLFLGFIHRQIWLPTQGEESTQIPGLSSCRFGLWIGFLFFLSSILAFVVAIFRERKDFFGGQEYIYEGVMWGGGHLLQHSSAVFLLIVWTIILGQFLGRSPSSRSRLFNVFAFMGLPLLGSFFLIFQPIESSLYRQGFTFLMQWGIFPGFIAYIWITRASFSELLKGKWWKNYSQVALMASVLLIVLGFLFGAGIRGSDLRIPGHYHASIGAVTVAYMAVSIALWSPGKNPKTATVALWSYGIGQTLFASGMYLAGYFGIPRKTYGSEIEIESIGQIVGFVILSIGGVIALIGGVLFAVSITSLTLQKIRS